MDESLEEEVLYYDLSVLLGRNVSVKSAYSSFLEYINGLGYTASYRRGDNYNKKRIISTQMMIWTLVIVILTDYQKLGLEH